MVCSAPIVCHFSILVVNHSIATCTKIVGAFGLGFPFSGAEHYFKDQSLLIPST